jgi:uncharacterized protein (TIGR00369 family)
MSTETSSSSAGKADHGSWGSTTQKVVEWYNPLDLAAAAAAMTGYEFFCALRDGELPPAPIASLLGFRPIEVEIGRVVFTCEPDESTYNPIGVVHGGLVCTLADTVIGCAVHSSLDAAHGYTSVDLNVSYFRPVTTASGVLRATGTLTKPGRRVAFGSAEIVDGNGKVVATATGACLVFERE